MTGEQGTDGPAGALRGKVVLITGAGSGVGRATALRLAREGAALVLTGRRPEPLAETAGLIGSASEVLVYPADVANAADVDALADAARQRFGGVDVLINAAGLNVAPRTLATVSVASYQEVIGANLNGAFYCAHAVLPSMKERGGGTIVNVASDAGLHAPAKSGVSYTASKFGMVGLTQAINAEERANGIRACVICPGDINTPLLDKRPVPPPQEARVAMLQAEDVAECVALAVLLPARALVEQLIVRPTNSPW